MKSLKNLAKLFHAVNAFFVLLLLALIFYLIYYYTNQYLASEELKKLWGLSIPMSLFIYLIILSKFTGKIEHKLFNEDLNNLVELLVIQVLLYGVITPFALFIYYIIYIVITEYKANLYGEWGNKEDTYFYPIFILQIGMYLLIPYVLIRYININIALYHAIQMGDFIKTGTLIYFGVLVLAFIHIKIAGRELKEKKYLKGAIRSVIIGLVTNPFTFHGVCFVGVGVFILYKENQFEAIKKEVTNLFDRINK